MKKIIRLLGQAACTLLLAAGLLAALFATFCVGAMAFVWAGEGALLPMDRPILVAGVKWLFGSCVLIATAWWLRCKILGKTGDNSFRLVKSKSGRLEEWVQKISTIGAFVVLVAWIWPRVPGSALMKVPVVAGWLAAGFLGGHVYIVFHELGHLTAAWIVGFDLRKMQVGVGPILRSYRFANGLLWQWRAWPIGGFMLATPRKTNGFRARQSFVVGAGPVADLILLWATYQLITHTFGGLVAALGQGPGAALAFALFWWTALAAVGGLIPHKVWLDQRQLWTDGYLLLQLWTGSGADFTAFAHRSNWKELLDLCQSDCPLGVVARGPVEVETCLASLKALQEQRALLSSRLLREASVTSASQA